MSRRELLESQDWRGLQAKLVAYAHKRIGRRSLDEARDLASGAVADLLRDPESWDPEKEPLLKHLAKRVIGRASNEWTRKRTTHEVRMRGRTEIAAEEVATDEEPIEDVLDRRRSSARLHDALEASFAGDDEALAVIALMKEGLDTPVAQARASGLSLATLKTTRRRIFYRAAQLAEELGLPIDDGRRRARPATDTNDDDAEEVLS